MDQQLKRGLLEACVLKVLTGGDSYGYQMIKDISPYIAISESTLYPILKRLEAAGAVSVYSLEHNSRLRRYYQIDEVGWARLAEFISEWQEVMRVYRWIQEQPSAPEEAPKCEPPPPALPASAEKSDLEKETEEEREDYVKG